MHAGPSMIVQLVALSIAIADMCALIVENGGDPAGLGGPHAQLVPRDER
jgi:hypothetical protein